MTTPRASRQTTQHTEVELSAQPRAAALARQAVRQLLGPRRLPAQVVENAQLIASELVTNAQRYGGPRVGLDLDVSGGTVSGGTVSGEVLTLAVADSSPTVPQFRRDTDVQQSRRDTSLAERGWGLPIVAALTTSWGVREFGHGKQVWATLPL